MLSLLKACMNDHLTTLEILFIVAKVNQAEYYKKC